MWFSAFILSCVILWEFIFFNDCLVKHLDILFNFFLKIDLIWWDKFSCNFKYIFINKIGFIKKFVLVVEQINKKYNFTGWGEASWGPKGWRWDKKIFSVMQDEAGMGQDKILWDGGEDHIRRTCTTPLPSLVLRQVTPHSPTYVTKRVTSSVLLS